MELAVPEDRASRLVSVLQKQGHDTLVDLPEVAPATSNMRRTGFLRELVRERIAVRETRARLWWTAFAPVLGCIVFVAIAAPMMPGSEGFAAAHYQLNTGLILFLAYGLAPLVAWSLVSLGLISGFERQPVAETS